MYEEIPKQKSPTNSLTKIGVHEKIDEDSKWNTDVFWAAISWSGYFVCP